MMKRTAAIVAVIGFSFGCGAADDRVHDGSGDGSAGTSPLSDAAASERLQAHAEHRICDGSTGIRLAIGYGGGGERYPYTSVLAELGDDFLYVDGTCHYWAHQPLSVTDVFYAWRPYREGVLAPADELRLYDAVSYGGLSADTCAARVSVPDEGSAFLWDGSELRSCADDSFSVSAPLRAELYDAATAVMGPMRIQVGKDSYQEARLVYEWPLDAPIEQFVIEYGETRSFRIDDVASVTALRSLREQAITAAAAAPGYFTGVIAIRSNEENEPYFMSLRDELPFVGADGSWLPAD